MADQQLAHHIRFSLERGKTKEEVYLELLNKGHKVDDIQAGWAMAFYRPARERETQQKTVNVIIILGALFIGAGIFSFVAANWQIMNRPVKVGVIVFSMLVVYAVGWSMKETLEYPRTGAAFILLGSIIYGAGIFLVAQMFNIRANWPDGLILWMLGAIAMAFAVDSYLQVFLALVLGIVALAGYPSSMFVRIVGHEPFLLTSSFLLLAATAAAFLTARAIQRKIPPRRRDVY